MPPENNQNPSYQPPQSPQPTTPPEPLVEPIPEPSFVPDPSFETEPAPGLDSVAPAQPLVSQPPVENRADVLQAAPLASVVSEPIVPETNNVPEPTAEQPVSFGGNEPGQPSSDPITLDPPLIAATEPQPVAVEPSQPVPGAEADKPLFAADAAAAAIVIGGQQVAAAGKSHKGGRAKIVILIILLVAILGLGAGFAYTQTIGKPEAKTVSNDSSSLAADEALGQEEAETVTEEQSEVVIDTEILDEDLGFTIQATKLIRNFPIPDSYATQQANNEAILVEVKISSDGTYTGAPSGSSLRLVTADGQTNTQTTILDEEMVAAGYTPLPFSGPSAGESTTGYVLFMVKKDSGSALTLRYKRTASQVLNGTDAGTAIPAKDFDVVLSQ